MDITSISKRCCSDHTDWFRVSLKIGVLFIVGFGTSMLFGAFIGQYADKYVSKRYPLC
jgi:putative Mn2+ efflux pump MntP